MRVNQTYIAVWQCRVTDSGGHVAYSAQVTIEFDESNLL
jgi:hypothetical protein